MAIRIHTHLVGRPRAITDEGGEWHSAIFREAVEGEIELGEHGLVGDQVADTKHHGSPDQAVCCHPLAHYDFWNEEYGLAPGDRIGPGGVGENWTLSGAMEPDVCIGDIFSVGTARVQVSQPRFPCWKQERKLGLPDFLRRTIETMRTGFYLRVLTPGTVQSGDALMLESRLYPELTVEAVNACIHRDVYPVVARRAIAAPELSPGWRDSMETKLARALQADAGANVKGS
jgi:MOSC domain-containing protein YiiM